QQCSKHGQLDDPQQRRGATCWHASRNQPTGHTSFLTHEPTPQPAQPAAEALCVTETGFRGHGPHLLHARSSYSVLLQSCWLAAINAFQSSGGLPRPSIFSKTAYGSDLLPADRKVCSSFTQA